MSAPCPRRRRCAAPIPIRGWNFSATACSASPSPTCSTSSFPRRRRGNLSRRLADLVRKETCADVARETGAWAPCPAAWARARPRPAAPRSPPFSATSANPCSARSFSTAASRRREALVRRFFPEKMRNPVRPLRDPKTALQEWAQARGLPTAGLSAVGPSGPDHAPVFHRSRSASMDLSRPWPRAAPNASPNRPARRIFWTREGVVGGGGMTEEIDQGSRRDRLRLRAR